MQGGPTTLTEHGLVSWGRATLPHSTHFWEFLLKKGHCFYLKMDSQWSWTNGFSGLLSVPTTVSWKISSSSCGCIMTLTITISKLSSWVDLSLLPLLCPTLLTSQEKWLTYGQKKEEVTAHGRIVIEKIWNGKLSTSNCSTLTSGLATWGGSQGMERPTLSDYGWQIHSVCSPTVTNLGHLWKYNSQSHRSMSEARSYSCNSLLCMLFNFKYLNH